MEKETFIAKLRQERKKIASLQGSKKIEYIWEYYKPALGIVAAVILVIAGIWSSISKIQEKTLLSVVVIDADREKRSAFNKMEKELETILKTGNEHENVLIDISATSSENPEAVMNTVMKLSVAQDNDVVILNHSQWQKFKAENPFANLKKILGESYPKYEPYIEEDALLVSESEKWNIGGYVQYKPAYLCVLAKTKRTDAVKCLVEYLFS